MCTHTDTHTRRMKTISAIHSVHLAPISIPQIRQCIQFKVIIILLLTVMWRCWQAIGYLIPLMDAEYANYYTREVMLILIREFQSPDEEMKKIVLKVVKQCCATDGVEPQYIKDEVLPPFFKHFWNQRMALDRRNYRQVGLLSRSYS